MRAADLLVETLVKAGIDKVFSLSGNQIMSIYDSSIDSPLEIIHTRHEAGAVFMADGYARTSGKTGVALVTAAPGFGNALGPLYSVSQLQTPLLLLSGDSPVSRDGMWAFQELNQTDIAAGLTKNSWRSTNAERLAEEVRGGLELAVTGRPGPVHIALPEDILKSDGGTRVADGEIAPERLELGMADLNTILSHLNEAQSPLILTGPCLAESRCPGMTAKLEASLGIPVITMQSPRGLNDPALGRFRSILSAADTILLIDKDIDFTLGFADEDIIPAQKFIMIAAEAESIAHANNLVSGRLVWGCMADPVTTVETLCGVTITTRHKAWQKKVSKAIKERPATPPATTGFASPVMVNTIAAHLENQDDPPLLVIDGGEIGQWAQAALPTAHMHINGMSGGIGGSIPQAIGAAFANPGRRVIAILGDGTAGFHFMEIEVARRRNLPITFIIGNDHRWGTEVEIQKRHYGEDRVTGCDLDDQTRYDLLAKGLGATGIVADSSDSLMKALDTAARSRGPVVINALIEGLPAPGF